MFDEVSFRDKCGAAAVAGFFQVLSVLKPKGIKAVGYMSMVRNSVGTGKYVCFHVRFVECFEKGCHGGLGVEAANDQ